ncbi:tryptophan 2,3-dioxygenase family protein [Marinoscillum sp. MHG1-6]|uniref:tryptophan 2,3-dioxygenase family protein n=1 Tax=Marinoscillum sp. MHG1-6 TaxID=2959627 RepID=UPI002157E826|nr:tryptophan 2,3-dioxygenase family protein [Marinoscillum sp. MHG1-6]
MGNRTFSPEILDKLEQLEAKYKSSGQNLGSYLDGLLHADYLTYWDYIHLDTLLSLQTPKTSFPDERIFILYHQISELYFRLILTEQERLTQGTFTREEFKRSLNRMNRYFDHLIDSFDVMIDGMDTDQFLQFRMSLLPASGFQSAQYRMIEINSTDFHLLVAPDQRDQFNEYSSIEDIYESLYWKRGATELATGKKTLTLIQFEEKYSKQFIQMAHDLKDTNLRQLYLKNFQGDKEVEHELRNLDYKANVTWPLMHYRSAARYLNRDPKEIKATGGTNWQKYLPPKKQQVVFYPGLYKEQEMEDWGKKENLH